MLLFNPWYVNDQCWKHVLYIICSFKVFFVCKPVREECTDEAFCIFWDVTVIGEGQGILVIHDFAVGAHQRVSIEWRVTWGYIQQHILLFFWMLPLFLPLWSLHLLGSFTFLGMCLRLLSLVSKNLNWSQNELLILCFCQDIPSGCRDLCSEV